MQNDDAQIVEHLLAEDDSFKRLYEKHRLLKQQVHEAVAGDLAVDDAALGKMKKEKLRAKDALTAMVEGARRVEA